MESLSLLIPQPVDHWLRQFDQELDRFFERKIGFATRLTHM